MYEYVCICMYTVYTKLIIKYEQNSAKIQMKIKCDDVGELFNGAENQILHLLFLSAPRSGRCVFVRKFISQEKR